MPNADVTRSAEPFMAGVRDNMVPVGKFLVSMKSFEVLHLTVQPRALGVFMMACSGKSIKQLGNNAGEMPVVVYKLLCFASSAWIFFIQLLQLECVNSGSRVLITHPTVQIMSPGGVVGLEPELIHGRNVMVSILVCFLFTSGRIFTSVPLRILALSSAFNLTLGHLRLYVNLATVVPEMWV